MNVRVPTWLGILGLLSGCGGVYAELAVTKLVSSQVDSSGTVTDGVGGTMVGFNVGVEFGGLPRRFAAGYSNQSLSSDAGDASVVGAMLRYDHPIAALSDKMKVRAGFGMEATNATSTGTDGMEIKDPGYVFMGGVAATYYALWKVPVNVFLGGVWTTHEVAGGTLTGTGVTARVAVAYTIKDPRPDQFFSISLDGGVDVTGALAKGGAAIGCRTISQHTGDASARLELECPGGRRIEFMQTASYMYITCRHELSRARCDALSGEIAKAAQEQP